MKKLLILPFLLLITSFILHKYYVSVMEINYKPASHQFEMIMRVFPDDIETILHDEYEIQADLSQRETKEFLYRYVYEKFHIWIGEEELAYEILGTAEKDEFLVILLQAEVPDNTHLIVVKNTLLQDLFDEQKNLLHFINQDKKQSFILDKENPEVEIEF